MAASMMLALGATAPTFALPDVRTGADVTLDDIAGVDGALVMFICNHCPYVRHVRHGLAELGRDYTGTGLGIVAISSNDISSHPNDGPEEMAREADDAGYPFPYLYDETQDVAKAYSAVCTPDFFLFDGTRALVYRGRFDDTRPNTLEKVTGRDLRAAIDLVLAGEPVTDDQYPSMGCSIKWKPDNEPAYVLG